MSDSVPSITPGNRVRVMQAIEAERNGLANKQGVVVGGVVRRDGVHVSFVVLDGHRETTHIPNSSLMVISRGTIT